MWLKTEHPAHWRDVLFVVMKVSVLLIILSTWVIITMDRQAEEQECAHEELTFVLWCSYWNCRQR